MNSPGNSARNIGNVINCDWLHNNLGTFKFGGFVRCLQTLDVQPNKTISPVKLVGFKMIDDIWFLTFGNFGRSLTGCLLGKRILTLMPSNASYYERFWLLTHFLCRAAIQAKIWRIATAIGRKSTRLVDLRTSDPSAPIAKTACSVRYRAER